MPALVLAALVGLAGCSPDESGILVTGSMDGTGDGSVGGGGPGPGAGGGGGNAGRDAGGNADRPTLLDGGSDGPQADLPPPADRPVFDLHLCTADEHACACAGDGDCHNPAEPRCSPANKCVACVATKDNCGAGTYCGPDLTCLPGCKPDDTCPGSMVCNPTTHTCVQCLRSEQCQLGMLCSSTGTCLPGCDPSMGKNCPGGLECCDKQCVDLAADAANCGKCGKACDSGETCCASKCVDTSRDVGNCGACGHACSTNNADASCMNGMCGWMCKGANAHCGTGNTGCETSINSASDCGACGQKCNTTNASAAACAPGPKCSYACNPGFGDCNVANAPNTDGCETSLATPSNCGACGQKCDPANASMATCNGTRCAYTCNRFFADCNAQAAPDLDGCETSLRSIKTCGGCNQACNADGASNLVAPTCDGTRCLYMCRPGYGNCRPSPPDLDGCETKLDSVANCGACGRACRTGLVVHATASACMGGARCTYTCSPGFQDCDNGPGGANVNGCETDLHSVTTCGACGQACTMTNASAQTCNGTKCAYTCNAGFGDCNDGATASNTNGCETPLNTTENCAACGKKCNPVHASAASCDGVKCSFTCDPGFSDCTAEDGCETPGVCVPPPAGP